MSDMIKLARQLAQSQAEVAGWRPIETAPRNGHGHDAALDVDLWHKKQGRLANCFWHNNLSVWMARSGGSAYNMGADDRFTHWMRKPAAPQIEAALAPHDARTTAGEAAERMRAAMVEFNAASEHAHAEGFRVTFGVSSETFSSGVPALRTICKLTIEPPPEAAVLALAGAGE